MARKIAVLGGTGAEGSGLAYRLAKAGEHILIGSREATRAQETAKLLRERIGGGMAEIEMDAAARGKGVLRDFAAVLIDDLAACFPCAELSARGSLRACAEG